MRASETVLENVRVLALDQRLGPTKTDPETEGKKSDAHPVAKTATLEVTPREAEIIALAGDMGSLSLALNSVRDGGDATPARRRGAARRSSTSPPSRCRRAA